MKVAAFTGSRTVSSARFRVRQLIAPLARRGVEVTEYTAPLGAWPPASRALRPAWAVATLATRLPGLAASYGCDLSLFQRELLSTRATLERLAKGPRVLDVDDAVWLGRERQIGRLLGGMHGAVCGNAFLADWVGRRVPSCVIVPTAVDTERFAPDPARRAARAAAGPVIGWSGLHAGAHYLQRVGGALARVLEAVPGASLRVVSDRPFRLPEVPDDRWTFVRWSPAVEVATLDDLTVGVMPLDDTLWERGKCSYKMLLYMACGVPVVVSPVGMNAEVLARGAVGHGARTEAEWVDALVALLRDPAAGERMGRAGRRVIEEEFSVAALAPRLADYLRTLTGSPHPSAPPERA